MNTVKSTWIGWGALCVAGGGAYYFAKSSINSDRAARHEAELRRKAALAAQEYQDRHRIPPPPTPSSAPPSNLQTPVPANDPSLQRAKLAQQNNVPDVAGSPSSEASNDPAPTRHEPDTDAQRVLEKSKYEAAEPFRPPRGNRFS
ncbi:conserved hypothetical protein [Paecilomyces variotii No. 5]|uniref:Uncharacterized protein n=1 Tax=Byssochlamys spectabilis (strain No. 5 / NBRC 109023) TaxID=1356009 RepID=V5FY50_BYSSN|nr:conserved hypothetical protein [Paecilomyces variotii No. 5]